MTAGNNSGGSQQAPKIDLRLSEQSQSDLQKFLKTMELVEKTVKATNSAFKTVSGSIGQNAEMLQTLKQDMKQFKMIADAMKRNAIMARGPGSYFAGEQFQANRRADRTARMGTEIGQQIELQREQLALAKRGLSYVQQQATTQQALNLNLRTHANTVNKITDLEKARALAAAAQLRQGIEAANGDARRAKSAQRIYDLAKARVAALEAEKRAAEQLAKAEERRAQRLRSLRYGDRQMEKAEAAAGRRKTLERLRGDGGAGLFAIQANVMANYVAMNAARNAVVGGVQFAAELDEAMRNLQAITVVTDENLNSLKGTILQVSEETKFFATDIANAAVTLGQAGFSTKEIQDSIRAVAMLATATGTDLAKSVDLATSILGVFNMESAQMAGVADTLTAAVNNSKLNIDKLTLGLQYAGNTAAQSGVSFEELTASLGAMANAGIRSGSTLGTGMRQILIALQKPSGHFLETLERLGITMEEVDLRSNGLYGVMQNLKDGGFTAADAIRSFEVRAAAAFNALSGNLGEVVKLERAFLNSSAATKANETQMRALSNQSRRFSANLQALISTGIEPMVYAVRDILKTSADWMEQLRSAPEPLKKIVVGVTSLAAAFVALRAASLAWGLTKMLLGVNTLISTVKTATTTMVAFRGVMGLALGPIGLATTAIGIGAMAWSSYRSEVEKAEDAIQKSQTAFDNAKGAMEATASQIQMVDGRIKELTDRSGILTENQDLLELETEKVREQFREMGIELGENVGSVHELISALQSLRGELAKEYQIRIGATADSLELLRSANTTRAEALRGTLPGDRVLRRYRKNGRNTREADFFEQLSNGGNSLDDLHRLRTEGESLLAAYQTIHDQEGLSGIDKDILDRLENAVKVTQQLIDLKSQDISLERQLGDIRRQRLVEENRQTNQALVDRSEGFGRNARGRVLSSVEGEADPKKRFEAARAEVAVLQTEATKLQQEINSSTDLLPEVRQALLKSIENNLAEAEIELDKILETAKDASETRAELEAMKLEAEADHLGTKLSFTENPSQVDYITAQRLANLNTQKKSQVEDLRIQNGGDTSSDAYLAELAKIEAEFEAQQREITEQAKARLATILGIGVRENETRIADLRRQLEDSNDQEARMALRDDIAKLLAENAEMKKEQAELTIEGARELEATVAEIEADLLDGLDGLSDGNEEDALKIAERNTEVARKALEEVIRLGDAAKTHAENAAWYKDVLEKAKAWASALRAQAALAAENDGVGENSIEDAEFDIQETLDGLSKTRDRNTKRINRSTKGGNPYKKKRDYIDKLIDDLEAKLDVAENYLAAGQTVSGEYDNVMETALAKVSEIHGQIDALQAKMAAGGLTVQEQERLNTLIDQQARMTNFIRQEEQRIALIKMQQGQYAEGIVLTTSAWVRENLSLSKTLQDGITGALSNAKNALSEFFQTWSDGTKSGKEAFKDLAVGVIQSIHKIFAEMLAVYLLQKALGWVNNTFGLDLPIPSAMGGDVKNAAEGDYVQGNLNRDSKRYNLMPGEYVLRRSAVQAIGVEELDRLNAMGNRVVSSSAHHGAAAQPAAKPKAGGDMNIYLVDERSQAGNLGPNDVIAIINDDISKGGTTKKLIKSVSRDQM